MTYSPLTSDASWWWGSTDERAISICRAVMWERADNNMVITHVDAGEMRKLLTERPGHWTGVLLSVTAPSSCHSVIIHLNFKLVFSSISANSLLLITLSTVCPAKLCFFFVTVPDPCPAGQALNEVKEKVEGGYRMEAPEDCPPGVYALMRTCWDQEPRRRPTFHKLRDRLEQEIGKHNSAPLVKDGDWDRSRFQCRSRDSATAERWWWWGRGTFFGGTWGILTLPIRGLWVKGGGTIWLWWNCGLCVKSINLKEPVAQVRNGQVTTPLPCCFGIRERSGLGLIVTDQVIISGVTRPVKLLLERTLPFEQQANLCCSPQVSLEKGTICSFIKKTVQPP